MSSAARRRGDDVAWPISQHAMLPAACRLAAGKTWTAAAAALAQSVVAVRLSSCAPLCETPSSSRQTAIYDFFSHLPVLSALAARPLLLPIFLRSDFCRERETMAPPM
jgi:hypothetical protein